MMAERLKNNESKDNNPYNDWSKLSDQSSDEFKKNSVQEPVDVKEESTYIGEEINKNLNLKKLLNFFDANAEILHKSRYHREDFRTHCLLMIGNMLTQREAGNVSEEAVIAACLHDIAKPRTAALNKRNEACFYGHENVTKEELTEFLDPNYHGFEKVLDLIHGHILPLGIGENTPEPFRSQNQKQLNALLERHDKQFEKDLLILTSCDNNASIKSDDDLSRVEEEISLIRKRIVRNIENTYNPNEL